MRRFVTAFAVMLAGASLAFSGDPSLVDTAASGEHMEAMRLLAVKGTTSAYAGDAEPVTRHRRGGPGRPPRAAYPGPPANLRTLSRTPSLISRALRVWSARTTSPSRALENSFSSSFGASVTPSV